MAKFYGEIGYGVTEETIPGVWTDSITARQYFGDFMRNTTSINEDSGNRNDNVRITNQISILADPFAYENFQNMRYVKFMGAAWEVKSVEIQYPRLILTLGGVYNGEQAETAGESGEDSGE